MIAHLKIIILPCLLLTASVLSGQQVEPQMKVLKRFFGVRVERFRPFGDWFACNDDSAFYKLDTVHLYGQESYHYHSGGCCIFTEWYIRSHHQLLSDELNLCHEPPTRIGSRYSEQVPKSRIRLKERHSNIYIVITRGSHELYRFRVIAIGTIELWEGGDNSTVLTLVRERVQY